ESASKAISYADSSSSSNGREKASPLAKKLAEARGYAIAKIKGSGEGGRIVKRDIETYEPSAQPVSPGAGKAAIPAPVGQESYEEVKVSQMRKTIAKRLSESKFTAPHFYVTMEINMDNAIAARNSLNEIAPVKISFN